MRLAVILLLLGLSGLPAFAQRVPVLQPGEAFTYRVGWGLFFSAGEIKIAADLPAAQPGRLRLTTTTRTRGIVHTLYAFDGAGESIFDLATGRLLLISEKSATETKHTQTTLSFDYKDQTFHYTNVLRPERSRTLPLPQGDPLDLITSLLQTRTWNLPLGGHRDVLAVFDDELYELTVYAERYEEITTSLGTFKTLELVPKMEKGPAKGMFKRGSTVRVWISQDERHLPVRFKVDFKFGAGVATLIRYEPPTAPVVANNATAPRP
jgi:Protein of unknown function (DUF3108)